MEGFIYFLQDGDAIKIGFATNPARRVRNLQTSHPRVLRTLGTMRAPKYQEQMLHHRFGHLRLRGEWFRAGPDLLDFIEDIEDQGLMIDMRVHIRNDKLLRMEKTK